MSSKWLTTLNFGGGCSMSPGSSVLCDMLVRSSPHIHASGPAPSVPIDEHCAMTGQLSLPSEGERRDGIVACFFSRCPRRRCPHLSLSGPRWTPGTEATKKTLEQKRLNRKFDLMNKRTIQSNIYKSVPF